MCVRENRDVTDLKLDDQLEYIRDVESLVRFECRTKNCHFATDHSNKLFKHEQSCFAETQMIYKQVAMHQPCNKIRRELVAEGYLPDESWQNWHFATFDVECLMDDVRALGGVRSIHRLTSIAIKASFEENGHYLERENMEPLSVKPLVQDLLSTLVYLRSEMMYLIPHTIIEGQREYTKKVQNKEFRKLSVERQAVDRKKLRFLNQCLALRIYSWNGERYDHNVVWAPILDIFSNSDTDFNYFNIIRRGTGIMQFSDGSLIFRDFLNMTSPMSLEDFARSCGVNEVSKTTFPYEYYKDIKDLHDSHEFPAYKCFYSSLPSKQAGFLEELEEIVTDNILLGWWADTQAANEFFGFEPPLTFERCGENWKVSSETRAEVLKMLNTSPKKYFESKNIFELEGCRSMADYLRLYNLNDVILLDKCIKKYAKGFYDSWQVNIHEKMSLPGVAQELAFKYYDDDATAIYTFGKKFKDFNEQIRKQLHGGMTLGSAFKTIFK